MKPIRVTMTPSRMERLLQGKSLHFKVNVDVPSDPVIEIEIILEDDADAWAKFDKIFAKIMDKVDKVTSAILK